jgi:hypothetical protein
MTARAPGASLFHPLALASLALLLFNDHYLKAAWPSALSGKLSDFAGVLLTPIVMFSAYELLWRRASRSNVDPRHENRVLALIALATAIGFALPEIWAPADYAYRYGLGALRFPFRAIGSLLRAGEWPDFRPVIATADVTDLLAVPMAFVAYRVAALPESPTARRRGSLVTPLVVLALLAPARPCSADTPARAESRVVAARKQTAYRHDGLFLDAGLGGGLLYVDSAASVSNGFRQAIPSTATGALAPVLSMAIGGTFRFWPGLVLAVRFSGGGANQPAISTLGERFSVRSHNLDIIQGNLFVRYYPDPTDGLHFGGGGGILALDVTQGESSFDSTGRIGDEQRGFGFLLEGGHGIWFAQQFSVAGTLQVVAGRVAGDHGASFVFAPQLLASVTWH